MRKSALACGWGMRDMSARLIVLASSLTLFPGLVTAQSATEASAIPRTPWGVPDLQGVWSCQTFTPLEREEKFTDKTVLPPEARSCTCRSVLTSRSCLPVRAQKVDSG